MGKLQLQMGHFLPLGASVTPAAAAMAALARAVTFQGFESLHPFFPILTLSSYTNLTVY